MVKVIDFLRLNLFASVLLLAGAGCVVIDESDRHTLDKFRISGGEGNVEEQLVVSNYGYYLFNCIPIFCGNARSDSTVAFSMFRDDVTLNATQKLLIDTVKPTKCNIVSMQPYAKSTCFFSMIPYLGNTLGLVWYKEVQISAVLIRPEKKKRTEKVEEK